MYNVTIRFQVDDENLKCTCGEGGKELYLSDENHVGCVPSGLHVQRGAQTERRGYSYDGVCNIARGFCETRAHFPKKKWGENMKIWKYYPTRLFLRAGGIQCYVHSIIKYIYIIHPGAELCTARELPWGTPCIAAAIVSRRKTWSEP